MTVRMYTHVAPFPGSPIYLEKGMPWVRGYTHMRTDTHTDNTSFLLSHLPFLNYTSANKEIESSRMHHPNPKHPSLLCNHDICISPGLVPTRL